MKINTKYVLLLVVALATLTSVSVASANHQWGKYAWDSGAPVELSIGSNLTNGWNSEFAVAVSDWNDSEVLELTGVTGNANNQEDCTPATGDIEVCNFDYGNNGWLGIASIWISKGKNISKANSKMNDHYFDSVAYYSDPLDPNVRLRWRQLVMCQEIGHDFGLDHQDEDFNNTPIGTCMDYTGNPLTDADVHPNAHDYEQLVAMYGAGGDDDGGSKGNNGRGRPSFVSAPEDAGEFGRAIGFDASGRANVFEQDIGKGEKLITHVFWAF